MGVVVYEGGRGLLEAGFGLAQLGTLALHVTKFYYLENITKEQQGKQSKEKIC